jgi:hypothetical protein
LVSQTPMNPAMVCGRRRRSGEEDHQNEDGCARVQRRSHHSGCGIGSHKSRMEIVWSLKFGCRGHQIIGWRRIGHAILVNMNPSGARITASSHGPAPRMYYEGRPLEI